ncbi:hypothetical protein [Spiroplasma endosymbiont of Nomada ruficornis]|uniref:hypothetical protein n=1 Tax=Spiroplasma endosymbiont of Nomada ruficornis TaxID=3066325 RepID=UPI00313AFE9D
MSYKHLGIDERIYIENHLKFKISEIAKILIEVLVLLFEKLIEIKIIIIIFH